MLLMTETHHPVRSAGTTVEQDPRWMAVLTRDPAADGQFVYGVRTTGIYCRPSCPSRAARPQNVALYATCDDAEAAGMRACLRCRPRGASSSEAQAALVEAACRTIETADEAPSLDALAEGAGVSPFHFHRVFKAATGLTPKAYADAHRAKRVRAELAGGTANVTEAIYGAGFNSAGRFYAAADEMLGMTPNAFRKGGKGTTVAFAVAECSLGPILVARSDRGVCAILLGDDADTLVRDLQDRFPASNLVGGDAAFEEVVAKVIGFVEAPRLGLDLPLDIRGTAFQQRVWQALRAIPAGETASYADIARRIGQPTASRAVARACADNKIAIAIPCHRVVRQDGDLSGYRWGVDRKRALLDREARA